MKNSKLNRHRRRFLKAGAALASSSLIPSSLLVANPSVKPKLVKSGSVNTAAHWGMLKVELKDGRVTKSEPLFKTSAIKNALQVNTKDLIYNSRIKKTYVRKSYLDNPSNPKPHLRGQEEFIAVPYKQAIALVANELKKTRRDKGSESIFAGSYGWKSIGNVHNCRTLLHRFMNLSGGFTGSLGDYSTAASQIIMPHVVGGIEVYEQNTSWDVILEHTKVMLIFGANPLATLRISWTGDDGQSFAYLEALKKSNIKLIFIDPVASTSVKYFTNATLIQPRPNTDTAIMLGMMHHIYTNKKHDEDFLNNYTIGLDKFLPYLLGTSDGIPKSIKWASNISGVDEKTIEELANLCVKDRSLLWSGWSLQRAHHGEQPHFALVVLASMIGQIGKPGGGFSISHHYSGNGVPMRLSANIGGMNAGGIGSFDEAGNFLGISKDMSAAGGTGQSWLQKLTDSAFPVARIADALLNPGKTIDFNGRKITYPHIDFIYWVGGNPVVHHQDTNKFIEALKKPRTIVMNLPYWTPSAKMCDVIFPATTQYERNDISMCGDYSNHAIAPMKQLVEKQFEAKDDYQIFSDLSIAYGGTELWKAYTEGGRGEMEWIEAFYDRARQAMESQEALKPKAKPFLTFWEDNNPIIFESNEESESFVKFSDFIDDPILNALGTPSGLIEIYSETIQKMGYEDAPPHPMWIEPIEWLGMTNKPAKFHMLSPHPLDRLHSQQSQTSLRERYAINGREPVLINPKDAKKLGIKTGDIVRIYNQRGEIIAGANVTNDVREEVIQIYEGVWYDPVNMGKRSLCKHGNPNVLTIDIPTSKLGVGNISHTALVNVEKFKGKTPVLSAFKPPKGA